MKSETDTTIGQGVDEGSLTEAQVEAVLEKGLASIEVDGKRVLVIIPDSTRTMPMPMFFRSLCRLLRPRTRAVDFLVALGTHAPMSEKALLRHVGLTDAEKAAHYPDVRLLNHAWDDPQALVELGSIPATEIETLSSGKFRQDVPVRLNKMVLDYDHLMVCGPVFPHEVVGFSGGNKYFFPGIAGPDIINFTHWMSALITSYEVIGTMDTPVRAVINRAASFIPRATSLVAAVVTHEGTAGVFVGSCKDAWAAAADLSSRRHIIWLQKPVKQVLSVLPAMYDELWVGAKGMYKTEPAIEDGGEVIIYAPHLHEVSVVHGAIIKQVGYHVRDYFLAHWDEFKHLSWGVLSHSTHLKGSGTYINGVERPRIQVTLATGLSESECRALNLGYRDHRAINPEDWAGREAEGILYVPKAGEYLYRVRK